jgi:hypothetical protein
MSVDAYRRLLSEIGLEPAPGYFQAAFSDSRAMPAATETAKRVATKHAQLGLDRIFIADDVDVAMEASAVPAGVSSEVLDGQDVGEVVLDRFFELFVRTRPRVAVRSPAVELSRVAEADALHVLVANLDHALRAQRRE